MFMSCTISNQSFGRMQIHHIGKKLHKGLESNPFTVNRQRLRVRNNKNSLLWLDLHLPISTLIPLRSFPSLKLKHKSYTLPRYIIHTYPVNVIIPASTYIRSRLIPSHRINITVPLSQRWLILPKNDQF